MNKTLTRKLIYIVAALAMLAMLIPAMAVPASAAGEATLTMTLVNPTSGTPTRLPEASPIGFNVSGSIVEVFCAPATNWSFVGWNLNNIATYSGSSQASIVAGFTAASNPVQVQGVYGDTEIQARLTNTQTSANATVSIEKKWGPITDTVITASTGTLLNWSQEHNEWYGTKDITDIVNGKVWAGLNPPANENHVLEGVILNWYLVPGDAIVPLTPGYTADLKTMVLGLGVPKLVKFAGTTWPNIHVKQTVTGLEGTSTVQLVVEGPEAVKVVVIPEYPFSGGINQMVTPEVTSQDFYITQNEAVPQVRWAGEKIVLQRNFGEHYAGHWVEFGLENQSVGTLEPISGNYSLADSKVWVRVDEEGYASVILKSTDEGQAIVDAGLYREYRSQRLNVNHTFVVYFLKFESLSLGDVAGKRVGHNTGLWEVIPLGRTNPWDPTGSYNGTQSPAVSDNTTQTLNVSQDALLRANVRGWFTNSNPSFRLSRLINPTWSNYNLLGDDVGPGATMNLPAGRWILPDDWATLAGPNWTQSRLHWDIMCDPYGTIYDANANLPANYWGLPTNAGSLGLGPYTKAIIPTPTTTPTRTPVSGMPVIGPFISGIETMTPTGWAITEQQGKDTGIYTVVPDANLDKWDAPMPPAKIIFQIQPSENSLAKAGYFKWANKTDIYYLKVGVSGAKVYTNPFYQILVPAHPAIPAFTESGYDWDSFDDDYGPYVLWKFLNRYTVTPLVATTDPTGHPTNVAVYSDNHGEAMVWLNGNWNLNLSGLLSQGSTADIPLGYTVGYTTVQATADYPYARGAHSPIQSNTDTKTWTWGGQVLGTDAHTYAVNVSPRIVSVKNDTRMVLSIGNYSTSTGDIVGTFPNQASKSPDKMVWVWVTDRDGLRAGVDGAKVTWKVNPNSGSNIWIATTTGKGISGYNEITQNIYLENGFLSLPAANPNDAAPSGGVITDGSVRQNGYSFLRIPTATEVLLFNKFWGATPAPNPANPDPLHPSTPGGTSTIRADATKYVVAAIKVTGGDGNTTSQARIDITIESHDFDITQSQSNIGQLHYETNVDLGIIDALDDGIRVGDANCDGTVNMGDVTAVERMILGYNSVTSNSVLNDDGTVDMGTVVKIERTILGLN